VIVMELSVGAQYSGMTIIELIGTPITLLRSMARGLGYSEMLDISVPEALFSFM
jgi:hypothetical protein